MRLYLDTVTQRLSTALDNADYSLSGILKRGWVPFQLYTHKDGVLYDYAGTGEFKIVARTDNEFDGEPLFQVEEGAIDAPSGEGEPWTTQVNTDTTESRAAFNFGDSNIANDEKVISIMLEVVYRETSGDEWTPSETLTVEFQNRVWNPDDVAPTPAALTFLAGKTVYVDSVRGNDATGARQTFFPFLTLAAAQAAALAGDTIIVGPGTYSEYGLGKDGVNWYGLPGAVIDISDSDEFDSAGPWLNVRSIFTDGGTDMKFSVLGYFDFIHNSATEVSDAHTIVLVTYGVQTEVHFQFQKAIAICTYDTSPIPRGHVAVAFNGSVQHIRGTYANSNGETFFAVSGKQFADVDISDHTLISDGAVSTTPNPNSLECFGAGEAGAEQYVNCGYARAIGYSTFYAGADSKQHINCKVSVSTFHPSAEMLLGASVSLNPDLVAYKPDGTLHTEVFQVGSDVNGLFTHSPDGTKWHLRVSNAGVVSAATI